ncbi:SRPBCC domain-containing protein [Echinicola sp. CAU 1574]|uniref:SRPBCC domain-containing protein n=1 Tax=Echinicola arenosa TaxID=2774144 RepID=A0ABR9ALG8_9BACT|nr:SRPBCC domain-containing protein [Echinicola arenosa]MBD8488750.1 SRPBCC domain-containing protein [Echinicola arenosa]
MANQKFDWSRFTIKTPIKSDVKTIYGAWTIPSKIESWFLRSAVFHNPLGQQRKPDEVIKVGDHYQWLWHGYPDEVMEKGEILEINGTDFLKFRFGKVGIVSVKIKADEGKSIVELTQEDIPHFDTTEENFHVGCKTGWTFYLANLNSILQGGVDLRNKGDNEAYMD